MKIGSLPACEPYGGIDSTPDPQKLFYEGRKFVMSEKFIEEEKNLINSFIVAYMSTKIVDAMPPKSEEALDLQVSFIKLKNMVSANDLDSAKKILQTVCDRISAINVLLEMIKS